MVVGKRQGDTRALVTAAFLAEDSQCWVVGLCLETCLSPILHALFWGGFTLEANSNNQEFEGGGRQERRDTEPVPSAVSPW